MYLGKKTAFLQQWQLLNCRERGFRKGGKQEIWRVWRKLFSAQGEIIQNRSSLQLFGATGKSSGMKMVNSYSIFPLWGWQFQGQGNSSDGSAVIASAVAHGSSARSSPCARRDICSGWTGGRNLSLPFFLHWFPLGKVWISPSFSRAWGNYKEDRTRHIWSGAAAGKCPVLQGMEVLCEWLWPFQYSRFWLIGHFPSFPCCKQGSCEICGQNKHSYVG